MWDDSACMGYVMRVFEVGGRCTMYCTVIGDPTGRPTKF